MDEEVEALFVIAIYVFMITAFTTPFLIGYLFIKISRTVKRANKVLDFIHENEEETRKFHE